MFHSSNANENVHRSNLNLLSQLNQDVEEETGNLSECIGMLRCSRMDGQIKANKLYSIIIVQQRIQIIMKYIRLKIE